MREKSRNLWKAGYKAPVPLKRREDTQRFAILISKRSKEVKLDKGSKFSCTILKLSIKGIPIKDKRANIN